MMNLSLFNYIMAPYSNQSIDIQTFQALKAGWHSSFDGKCPKNISTCQPVDMNRSAYT